MTDQGGVKIGVDPIYYIDEERGILSHHRQLLQRWPLRVWKVTEIY